ncbi:hypothetical protein Thal_0587 [Thermocrinis albus DSM 14484]|uniref:Uncharacterized protein n=1 Tax=Thermocrinis albus (strain DSM 14484 / JCM 11386 / HI 11/12) TaxID=638303 RepID=D3SPY4_THEAH|nr:hypothetical protein [Thermocrinis albus]ADC89221.1 hypothetical protein Thal_0587 [Thermocrinis albus DSM 14484]
MVVCLTHLELCPHCKRIALKVCEYDDPYPRVEAHCQCCGYRAYDVPMNLRKEDFRNILDLLGRKLIGEVCLDNRCGSSNVLKLIQEGSYSEYRCLDCGAEWNTDDIKRAILRVKSIRDSLKNGNRLLDLLKAGEGECPLCGWDIGHQHKGYAVVIQCFVCGYHNDVQEEIPHVDLTSLQCPEYERSEETG